MRRRCAGDILVDAARMLVVLFSCYGWRGIKVYGRPWAAKTDTTGHIFLRLHNTFCKVNLLFMMGRCSCETALALGRLT